MWSKFKKWLNTADDEEGLTGYDAIFAFFWNLMAWSMIIIGGLFLR